jgi:hypothetical protein
VTGLATTATGSLQLLTPTLHTIKTTVTIPQKAVAISASEHDGLNYLYALGESGIVYDFDYSAQKWDPLPPLPPVEASDDCQAPKLHTWIVAFDSGRESVVRNCSSSDEAMSIARSAYPNEQISFVRIAQPEIAPPSTSTHEVPEFIDMCHPPPCATVQPIATIAVRAKCFDVADKAFRKEFPHAKILRVTKMPSQELGRYMDMDGDNQ